MTALSWPDGCPYTVGELAAQRGHIHCRRRRNRRAQTGGVVRDNRIGDVRISRDGYATGYTAPWYYRRHTVDGRVFTGPADQVYAGYLPGQRPIPARRP